MVNARARNVFGLSGELRSSSCQCVYIFSHLLTALRCGLSFGGGWCERLRMACVWVVARGRDAGEARTRLDDDRCLCDARLCWYCELVKHSVRCGLRGAGNVVLLFVVSYVRLTCVFIVHRVVSVRWAHKRVFRCVDAPECGFYVSHLRVRASFSVRFIYASPKLQNRY